jgi:tetratricopeptide (TPR) repeat protein
MMFRSIALIIACSGVLAGAQKERFEFRGRVLQESGRPFDATPVVFLHGSVTPFTAKTEADGDGRFKFKDLLPGMYTLVIAVPRAGELSQTIEVGPSFADPKGRVEHSFRFERKLLPDELHEVSAAQLAVPEKAQREYEKAQEYLGKRDIARAVTHLKKAVELSPEFSSAWNNLGTIAYQSQAYKDAEGYFRQALHHDPDSYAPLVNLGGALLSQGMAKESLPVNLKAVKARPGDALAHSQLGQSYFFLGQLDEGERHLKQAKVLDPRHFSFPQLPLAEIYGRRLDYVSAAGELEEFLRYHPDSKIAAGVAKALETARARIKSR